MENTQLNDTRLSSHFKLGEFLNLGKYPDNKPTMTQRVCPRESFISNVVLSIIIVPAQYKLFRNFIRLFGNNSYICNQKYNLQDVKHFKTILPMT